MSARSDSSGACPSEVAQWVRNASPDSLCRLFAELSDITVLTIVSAGDIVLKRRGIAPPPHPATPVVGSSSGRDGTASTAAVPSIPASSKPKGLKEVKKKDGRTLFVPYRAPAELPPDLKRAQEAHAVEFNNRKKFLADKGWVFTPKDHTLVGPGVDAGPSGIRVDDQRYLQWFNRWVTFNIKIRELLKATNDLSAKCGRKERQLNDLPDWMFRALDREGVDYPHTFALGGTPDQQSEPEDIPMATELKEGEIPSHVESPMPRPKKSKQALASAQLTAFSTASELKARKRAQEILSPVKPAEVLRANKRSKKTTKKPTPNESQASASDVV